MTCKIHCSLKKKQDANRGPSNTTFCVKILKKKKDTNLLIKVRLFLDAYTGIRRALGGGKEDRKRGTLTAHAFLPFKMCVMNVFATHRNK